MGEGCNDFRARVGERIRRRRIAAGLSQAALARQLPGAIESGHVSRWEVGRVFPSLTNIGALARIFGCTEEELLCDECEDLEIAAHSHRGPVPGVVRLAVSAKYIVTEWDAGTEALLGWTAEEAIGRPSWEVAPSTDPNGRLDRIRHLAHQGRVWEGALTLIAKDGRHVPVDVRITFDGHVYRSELRPPPRELGLAAGGAL